MPKRNLDYVRKFETDDRCIPNCYIVVRVDGSNFSKFAEQHFKRPNDDRAFGLMTCSARSVMEHLEDIVLAYGQSDEYSFVFRRSTTLFNRKASKLLTHVNSQFASSFVLYWKDFFGEEPLQDPPSFDGRVVLYPTNQNLKVYVSCRQEDGQVNNLNNTAFWTLVQNEKEPHTRAEAEKLLKNKQGADRKKLLLKFGINYQNDSPLHRRGTILFWEKREETVFKSVTLPGEEEKEKEVTRTRKSLEPLHCELNDQFWEEHPDILEED